MTKIGHFEYTMSLGGFSELDKLNRKYGDNIGFVTFDISRYGKYTHTIEFPIGNSNLLNALARVEKYLSLPVTQEYFDKVKDDIFHEDNTMDDYECRGDLLSDARFLEVIKGVKTIPAMVVEEDEWCWHITLLCGT